jgi:branched-chain amino acid transport system permease protein
VFDEKQLDRRVEDRADFRNIFRIRPQSPPRRKPMTARRVVRIAVGLLALGYLPIVLLHQSIFGLGLSYQEMLGLNLPYLDLALLFMIGTIALNYLTGYAGLLSIGSAAFFAVGELAASAVGGLWGMPFVVAILAAACAGAIAGALAGLPAIRVRGLYLLLSTLSLFFIMVYLFSAYQQRYFGIAGVTFPEARIGPFALNTNLRWYYVLVCLILVLWIADRHTRRSRAGRALMAVRDNELAAAASGINVGMLRIRAFAVSAGVAAAGGGLYGYYILTVSQEDLTLTFAVGFVAMLLIGGLGSFAGAVVGTLIWELATPVISTYASGTGGSLPVIGNLITNYQAQTTEVILAVLLIVVLIIEPGGIAELGRRLGRRLSAWMPRRTP